MDILTIIGICALVIVQLAIYYVQRKFTAARNFLAENLSKTQKFLSASEATIKDVQKADTGGITFQESSKNYIFGTPEEQIEYELRKKLMIDAEKRTIKEKAKQKNTQKLIAAIMIGDDTHVKYLLEEPVDVNATDSLTLNKPIELALQLLIAEANTYKHVMFKHIAHFLSSISKLPFIICCISTVLATLFWGINTWARITNPSQAIIIAADFDQLLGIATLGFLATLILSLPNLIADVSQKLNYNNQYWDGLQHRAAIVQMLLNNINLNLHTTALQTDKDHAQQLFHWLRSSNMHTEAILTKLVRDVKGGKYTMLYVERR